MRVMTFGTFDNLHPGHLDYFKQARLFGDELIVIIARDKNVLAIKKRAPQDDEKTRQRKVRRALKELGITGRAVLGNLKNRWLILKKYRPEIICLGYDQQVDLPQLKSEIAGFRFFCKIKRLKAHHPEKYKSSFCRV
ncbi:MAG: adenylyltransferase/cytidyltransferase family protein [Patescibacteria group bacterium]|jgi:FAD synthetase